MTDRDLNSNDRDNLENFIGTVLVEPHVDWQLLIKNGSTTNKWLENGAYTGICQKEYVIYQIRDGLAPVFSFYYILSEGIFYIKLFSTLKNIHASEASNNNILRSRTYQTILFTLDLSILLAMSIYRMFYLTSNVPSYVYAELFSSALTNSIPPRNQGSTAHCDLNKKPSIIGGINTDQKNDIVSDDDKLNNDHNRKNLISALRTTARKFIARERRNAKEKSRVSFQEFLLSTTSSLCTCSRRPHL
ncbi:12398_t:CDS:2 [Ambispora leptoticha]|uniref:12398_t:CDS:1 n=1 Tax=Ambispora leptoticha TaxID=144679 RepID=A0A9N9AWZ5_9GLOM|nr:12398_t:CDS:2 [Ambispora leptoticha]